MAVFGLLIFAVSFGYFGQIFRICGPEGHLTNFVYICDCNARQRVL